MTEPHVHTAEFEATIGRGGTISIPDDLAAALDLNEGGKVSVRVVTHSVMAALKRGGVTNEEIDRIAAMQLEPAGQVMKFLLSEGALARKSVKGKDRRTRGRSR